MRATEPGVLLPAEPGGPRLSKRKAAGWSMTGAGGGLMVEQMAASGGLPANGDEWAMFGLKALLAIIGLLLGGGK